MRPAWTCSIASWLLLASTAGGCGDDDPKTTDTTDGASHEVADTTLDEGDALADDDAHDVPDDTTAEPDVAEVVYGDVLYAEVLLPLAPDNHASG